MLMRFLGQTEPEDDTFTQKRRFERRSCDQCVAEVKGKTYPVVDWSQGGALITVDDRLFAEQDQLDVTMKFHVNDQIVPVSLFGKIIRKGRGRIAFHFDPLKEDTRRTFQQIIDDVNARAFADSQV